MLDHSSAKSISYLINAQIAWTVEVLRYQSTLKRLDGARMVYASNYGACLFVLVDKPGGRILTAHTKMEIGG